MSAGGLSRLGERYPGCLLAAGGCEDELSAALFGDLTNQGWPIFLKQREGVVLVACLTGQQLLLALAVHFPGELAIGLESQCDRQVRGGLSLPGTHEAGRRRLGLRRLLCRRRLCRGCACRLGRCRRGAGGLPRGCDIHLGRLPCRLFGHLLQSLDERGRELVGRLQLRDLLELAGRRARVPLDQVVVAKQERLRGREAGWYRCPRPGKGRPGWTSSSQVRPRARRNRQPPPRRNASTRTDRAPGIRARPGHWACP